MDVLCQSFPAMLHVEEKNPRGIGGKTKLEFAAEQGNFKVCKLIIDSINENSIKELTPLIWGMKNMVLQAWLFAIKLLRKWKSYPIIEDFN